MVPPEFAVYFTTMAAVEATLFGLIFVVISISPESLTNPSAPLERQVKAFTAYIALLNPLVISLCALVPHQEVGVVVLPIGFFGFANTLVMALTLSKNLAHRSEKIRGSAFILIGFLLYGYEIYAAYRILQNPSDITAFSLLADLLIGITLFGIIRAWDLVGIRRFYIGDWLSSLEDRRKKDNN